MVRPFDIEEIFPEFSAEPARRRRRRQSDSSAQGLAVTLVADYTASTRAWLPSAAIVALLGEFGVTSGAARTSISRLARRGVLEVSRRGRFERVPADRRRRGRPVQRRHRDRRRRGGTRTPGTARGRSWSSRYRRRQESTRRRALRDHLRWSGYAPLYDGVWISPDPLPPQERAALAAAARGSVTVFRARHEELEAEVDRNPVEAWDLPGIAKEYETFIDQWACTAAPDRRRFGDRCCSGAGPHGGDERLPPVPGPRPDAPHGPDAAGLATSTRHGGVRRRSMTGCCGRPRTTSAPW